MATRLSRVREKISSRGAFLIAVSGALVVAAIATVLDIDPAAAAERSAEAKKLIASLPYSPSVLARRLEQVQGALSADKYTQLTNLVKSFSSQVDACAASIEDLARRTATGAPNWALADGQKHVASCTTASQQHSGLIGTILGMK